MRLRRPGVGWTGQATALVAATLSQTHPIETHAAAASSAPTPQCPLVSPIAPGLGWSQSAPSPLASAIRLDLEGQQAYQKRDYGEAKRAFAEATKADPTYLSPRLTMACIHLRQDKVAEAVAGLASLFQYGFVPWHRVALGDIDLAALWAQAPSTPLPKAIAAAATAWGRRVEPGVLLLSRLAPAVKLAAQDGPLILRPAQEVISWNPQTGRFHQVTSEGGRVLAFLRSPSGNEVLYVTAQKVRRQRGRLHSFEDVGVHLLRLTDMFLISLRLTPAKQGATKVVLRFDKGRGQVGAVFSSGEKAAYALQSALQPLQTPSLPEIGAVVLTPAGIIAAGRPDVRLSRGCVLQLRPATHENIPTVLVVTRKGQRLKIPSRFGLGLHGLPLPEMSR